MLVITLRAKADILEEVLSIPAMQYIPAIILEGKGLSRMVCGIRAMVIGHALMSHRMREI
jgi:hypothetical protein